MMVPEANMNEDFEVKPTITFDRATFLSKLATGELADAVDAAPTAVVAVDPTAEALAQADMLDTHGHEEMKRGGFNAARVLYERAVEIRRQWLGAADPHMMQSFSWLGSVALREGRLDEAQWLYDQARAVAEKKYGAEHPQVATMLNNLGVLARRRGDLALATDLYKAALAIKLEYLGWQHGSVAATLSNLGRLALASGDLRAALCHFARAREILEATAGGASPTLATVLIGMGRVHLQLGMPDTAVWVFERALRIREADHVTPAQLADARLLLAMALTHSEPDRARALVVLGLREYETSAQPRVEQTAALQGWLRRLDRHRPMRLAS